MRAKAGLTALLAVVLASAEVARAEPLGCRRVVAWDVASDLVAYELPRRCDPVKAASAPRSLFELRRISIEVYKRGSQYAAQRGIILADTKFEFGRHAGAEIVLGDEVLTPDSSRFWPAASYQPGATPPSFDKQYVRDWASETGWDKKPPAPELPPDVVEQTRAKYVEAYERITGESF